MYTVAMLSGSGHCHGEDLRSTPKGCFPLPAQPLAWLAAETSRRGGPGEQNHIFELRPQAGDTYGRADEMPTCSTLQQPEEGWPCIPHHQLSTSTAALHVPMLPSVARSPALVLPDTTFSHRKHCRFVGVQLGKSQPGISFFFFVSAPGEAVGLHAC